MTTVEIKKIESLDEIICKYNGQTSIQDVYVELDCRTGILTASYNPEIGNSISFNVFHGHDQRWGVNPMHVDTINDFMLEIEPLCQRVLDGYRDHWDGSHFVARFSEDASDAIDEIERLTEKTGDLEVWDADGYLDPVELWSEDKKGCEVDGTRITGETTDDELSDLAEEIEVYASRDGHYVTGTLDHLESIRDQINLWAD